MSDGPFRDTLTPLIAQAQDQLAELRRERAALERRHAAALAALEQKARLPQPLPSIRPAEPLSPAQLRTHRRNAFISGLLLGLVTWFPILGRERHPAP